MSRIEQQVAAIPFIREDIEEVKRSCAAVELMVRSDHQEDRRLSMQQVAIVVSGIVILLAAVIGAIASLVSAGAF